MRFMIYIMDTAIARMGAGETQVDETLGESQSEAGKGRRFLSPGTPDQFIAKPMCALLPGVTRGVRRLKVFNSFFSIY